LEVIESEGLIERAASSGKHLLDSLHAVAAAHPQLVDNVRGCGLMCAFDLPDGAIRDEVVTRLRREEHVVVLGSGERSVRFRPALTVSDEELDAACAAVDRVLRRVSA
ncbi:MAG TPA: aminotransferase class III-fold pyridoxal phosphate-dependent enzyme, partial [Egibacteraceae bacterium]